jgi:hypothetical protein
MSDISYHLNKYIVNSFPPNIILFLKSSWWSQGSSVGIAPRPQAGQSAVQILVAARDIPVLQKRPDWLCDPLSLLFNAYRGSFPEEKGPRHEDEHSTASSAEAKNEWSYISAPPLCLHGEDRDNFIVLSFYSSWQHSLDRTCKCSIAFSIKI